LLKKTASENIISTGGSRIPASGNDDFHWPLALAALKSASENVSRTAIIKAVCTSEIVLGKEGFADALFAEPSLPSVTLGKAFAGCF
jgi:hypothetical protein